MERRAMSAVALVVTSYLAGAGTCALAAWYGRKIAENAPPTLEEVRAARDQLTAVLDEQEALEDAYYGAQFVPYPLIHMDGGHRC